MQGLGKALAYKNYGGLIGGPYKLLTRSEFSLQISDSIYYSIRVLENVHRSTSLFFLGHMSQRSLGLLFQDPSSRKRAAKRKIFILKSIIRGGETLSKKILVVDDEKPIADILKYNLEKEGYFVELAFDGEEALEKTYSVKPDLIILDIMLPKMDGFAVCKRLRQDIQTPIIMLTAKEEEVDKVLGLELGADDYITKPFGVRELLARVKANLRRVDLVQGNGSSSTNLIKSGNLVIDLNRYEVRKGNRVIELTLREFELLKYLASQSEQVFTRETLLEDVWGYEYYGDVRTVDVTVRRLREKIEDDSSNPKYIITKRGVGYYFRRV